MGPSSDFTNSHMKRDLPEELVFGVHSTNVCSGSAMNRNCAKHQKGVIFNNPLLKELPVSDHSINYAGQN